MELTGTRMGSGRVCKRESEWRKDKEDAEHVLNGRRDLFDASPTRPGGWARPDIFRKLAFKPFVA